MTIDQIIHKIKEHNPEADTTIVSLAYDFAKMAHKGQKRLSGEPYIQHCLHTAYTLTQIKADIPTIIAGLLHDVPEDTTYTLKDVEKNFGKEIATLVCGITKLSKIKYRGVDRYVESLRKMFLAITSDLRIALIKFADRLHNLKTLDAQPPEKQQRIAKETLEIYAPIAGLLGVEHLKWQIEDICFKYIYPEEYKKLEYRYEVEKKIERNQYFSRIKNILMKELQNANIDCTINHRFKHLYSIYQKMHEKDRQFNEIYDVFAMRVVVKDISDCYKTLGIIHSLWKPAHKRFKDYIGLPKPNGYRSLHTTVFGPDGRPTEFQIRTKEMYEEALYGIAAHWQYKTEGDRRNEHQPKWITEILELQKEASSTLDFITQAKIDVFRDRIFVFSPKGDVIDLPIDSTSVDFAYAVHTDIGNQCSGAIINGKIASLNTPLKNGDVIEIIREKQRKYPNLSWLKFTKTHRAQSKIKQHSRYSKLGALANYIPGFPGKN
ncbi:bifunctional (p)ppGpp synthetase/guanosine-3',5'-bis(diphosphate) 3'-pyrophosphohydrolase [Patescibacteria group bacterium]|nr:bifunctional (p)ppGpp synthetase/guanosine-3',5'-bis(diphosphate) 3'-pyrophosphohydrolase [Patescibacteria group bacterium]